MAYVVRGRNDVVNFPVDECMMVKDDSRQTTAGL